MIWAIPAGMAAIGLAKGILDEGREKRDRKLASVTARYSPWTGLAPQPVKEADPLGSAMQGGMAGLQLGQGIEQTDAYTNWLQKQGATPVTPGAVVPVVAPPAPMQPMQPLQPIGPSPAPQKMAGPYANYYSPWNYMAGS
jgi:hypothetical protein